MYFSDSPNYEYTLYDVPRIDEADRPYKELKIDGYIPLDIRKQKEPDATRPLAIEFHGCAWHGCEKCYEDDRVIGGQTVMLRRHLSEARVKALEAQGIEVRVVMEHEVSEDLKYNPELKAEFEKMIDLSPINPREAFFGGKISLFFQKNCIFRSHWAPKVTPPAETRRKNLLL